MPRNHKYSKAQQRADFLKLNPIKGNFDIAHLKAIHAYIFQDSPQLQAGNFRPETKTKDWFKQRERLETIDVRPWVAYSPMDKTSEDQLSKILESADPSALSKLNKKQFTQKMADLYANLDYIHPFLEGNSRTLRVFTHQLAKEAGFDLRWERFNRLADRRGRDLLYIARDMATNEMALPHIHNAKLREYVQGSMQYFEELGYQDLPSLLNTAITPRDYRLHRDISNLLVNEAEKTASTQSITPPQKQRVQAMADRKSASTRSRSNSAIKKTAAEEFSEQIIKQLEEGTAPWVRPWEAGELEIPYNQATGKPYRGMNTIRLLSQGHSDPRWMTYKQAQEAGAQVRKGEKSTRLSFLRTTKEEVKRDASGRPIKDADGNLVKEVVKLERPFPISFAVFNAEQIDGLPELVRPEPNPEKEIKVNARCEAILKASGAKIEHRLSGGAFYSPKDDKIVLPAIHLFHKESGYSSTALHELGHWTGHESRLNRDLRHAFGSIGYAKEELRAEIGSLMLSMDLGIGYDPGNHLAYIQSWIKVLKDDPEEIVRACRDAEKIKSMVLEFENTQEKTAEISNDKEFGAELAEKLREQLKHPDVEKPFESLTAEERVKVALQEKVDNLKGTRTYLPIDIEIDKSGKPIGLSEEEYKDLEITYDPRVGLFFANNAAPEKLSHFFSAPHPAYEELATVAQQYWDERTKTPPTKELQTSEVLLKGLVEKQVRTPSERLVYNLEEERVEDAFDAILAEKGKSDSSVLTVEEMFGRFDLRETKAGSSSPILAQTKSILSASSREELENKVIALSLQDDINAGGLGDWGIFQTHSYKATLQADLDFSLATREEMVEKNLTPDDTAIEKEKKALALIEEKERELENTSKDIYSIYDASEESNPDNFLEVFVAGELAKDPQQVVDILNQHGDQMADHIPQWQLHKLESTDSFPQPPQSSLQELEKWIDKTIESGHFVNHSQENLEIKEIVVERYNQRYGLTGDNKVQLEDDGELSIADGDLDAISKEIETLSEEVIAEKIGENLARNLPSLGDNHFDYLAEEKFEVLSTRLRDYGFSKEECQRAYTQDVLDSIVSDFVDMDMDGSALSQKRSPLIIQTFTKEWLKEFMPAGENWLEEQLGRTTQLHDLDFLKESLEKMDHPTMNYNYILGGIKAEQQNTQYPAKDTITVPSQSLKEFSKQLNKGKETLEQEQKSPSQSSASKTSDKSIFINVSYDEKREAKELGAKWNKKEKSWYIPAGVSSEGFEKWMTPHPLNRPPRPEKIYLAVPAPDVSEVKRKGALFDEDKKAWFIDTTKKFDSSLEQWTATNQENATTLPPEKKVNIQRQALYEAPKISPEESLANKFRELNLQVPNEFHFDGEIHPVPTNDNRGGKKSGFYIVFPNDGRPAGTVGNHKTGAVEKWFPEENRRQSKAEIEAQKLITAQRQANREKARKELQEKTAEAVSKEFKTLTEIQRPTTYMQNKGISLDAAKGLKVDTKGNTVVPMYDVTGKQWNSQSILKDGSKLFQKSAKKEGCFFPFSGLESLKKAPAIIIAEGIATGASIHEATLNAPNVKAEVISAFDSGNLLSVAKDIRKVFPDKPIIFAADNDVHCLMTNGHNVGREKAEAAAKAVGGKVVLPVFSNKDKSWPQDVPKFTPNEYKIGKLTKEQKEALSEYKKLTDFNDLAQKTEFGKGILASQFRGELAVIRSKQEKQKPAVLSPTQTQTRPAPAKARKAREGAER